MTTHQRTKAQVHTDYRLHEDAVGLLLLKKAIERTQRMTRHRIQRWGKPVPYVEETYRDALDKEMKRQHIRRAKGLIKAEL